MLSPRVRSSVTPYPISIVCKNVLSTASKEPASTALSRSFELEIDSNSVNSVLKPNENVPLFKVMAGIVIADPLVPAP